MGLITDDRFGITPSAPNGGSPGSAASAARPLAAPLLKLIWEQRRISRADIARMTGLSRSTVTEAVKDLLRTGLVHETGTGETSGGRRPIMLEFQDDACGILGVDIGATHVGVALTNLRGQVVEWRIQGHPVREDPKGTRALALRLCRECRAAWADGRQLLGIGVGMPCPIDPRQPFLVSEVVMPRWKGRNGLEELRDKLGLPLLVDNDANLGALAEHWWGAGRGVDDFAYIKVATGIGLGHILGGQIYRGSAGVAGEIGHLAIDPHGRPCVCGLKGCLATYAGTAALLDEAVRLLPEYPASALHGGTPDLARIADAAVAGDPLARRVVREAAEYLGITVAGLLNLNNPSVVVLGGGLTRVEEVLLEPLRETVRRRTLVSSISATRIITSQLGPRAVAIGASTLMLDAVFADPTLFHKWPAGRSA
ncbi:MAG: ROK family transcriptional regulator [Candidatus Delongbacteria bacterium]